MPEGPEQRLCFVFETAKKIWFGMIWRSEMPEEEGGSGRTSKIKGRSAIDCFVVLLLEYYVWLNCFARHLISAQTNTLQTSCIQHSVFLQYFASFIFSLMWTSPQNDCFHPIAYSQTFDINLRQLRRPNFTCGQIKPLFLHKTRVLSQGGRQGWN